MDVPVKINVYCRFKSTTFSVGKKKKGDRKESVDYKYHKHIIAFLSVFLCQIRNWRWFFKRNVNNSISIGSDHVFFCTIAEWFGSILILSIGSVPVLQRTHSFKCSYPPKQKELLIIIQCHAESKCCPVDCLPVGLLSAPFAFYLFLSQRA